MLRLPAQAWYEVDLISRQNQRFFFSWYQMNQTSQYAIYALMSPHRQTSASAFVFSRTRQVLPTLSWQLLKKSDPYLCKFRYFQLDGVKYSMNSKGLECWIWWYPPSRFAQTLATTSCQGYWTSSCQMELSSSLYTGMQSSTTWSWNLPSWFTISSYLPQLFSCWVMNCFWKLNTSKWTSSQMKCGQIFQCDFIGFGFWLWFSGNSAGLKPFWYMWLILLTTIQRSGSISLTLCRSIVKQGSWQGYQFNGERRYRYPRGYWNLIQFFEGYCQIWGRISVLAS